MSGDDAYVDVDDTNFADDFHGDYTLEEYNIGPSEQTLEKQDVSSLDFRMDAPPPERSMEARLRDASERAPDGMQLSRDAGGCCGSGSGGSSNTGVKAVKADFEASKQALRNERMRDNLRKERMLNPQQRVVLEEIDNDKKKHLKSKDSDEEDDSDAEDEAAFAAYRASRIAMVQNSLPRFGNFVRVTKGQFADLVKNTHELCYVVCHLYQNNVEACARLNLSFEALAPQFPHVKFVRLRANEAMAHFKAAGLPALMVYKGGQMVTQALRVGDAMPRAFTDVDVARLLQAKGILTVPTGLVDKSSWLYEKRREEGQAWSDEENEIAEAENQAGTLGLFSGLNLADGGSSAAASGSSKTRLQKGKFQVSRRDQDSGSDSD